MRRIDVKAACMAYLQTERERQLATGLHSPWVLPGGGARRPGMANRPLSPDAPQDAFE